MPAARRANTFTSAPPDVVSRHHAHRLARHRGGRKIVGACSPNTSPDDLGASPGVGHRGGMRAAIVSESFLPQVNGVTNSVLRVCEQLERHGHDVLVVAPGPGPQRYAGARVIRTPSIPLPGYRDFRLARPWVGLVAALEGFSPDVLHLASPTVLGAQAGFLARRMGGAAEQWARSARSRSAPQPISSPARPGRKSWPNCISSQSVGCSWCSLTVSRPDAALPVAATAIGRASWTC